MELPGEYIDLMRTLLEEEFFAFQASYHEFRTYGLRVNTTKISVEDFKRVAPFSLTPVPWAYEGFYYPLEDEPGKHPYHDAGLYYIQEPSAMAVTSILDPQPGERILDLAAAPGGKCTHIASRLKGEGLLVANEVIYNRAKVLSQNVERLGIRNCIVISESPPVLAKRFPDYFDRVLVDAPCSGEGMFRKDPEACGEWSLQHVRGCSARQRNILDSAAELVASGGVLAYSTCTFNPLENEEVITDFLTNHPEFVLEEPPDHPGFSPGEPSWSQAENPELRKAVRLWPHRVKGEGHFVALLRKTTGQTGKGNQLNWKPPTFEEPKQFREFAAQYLNFVPEGEPVLFGQNLYLMPKGSPSLKGLKVLRPGWHLGTLRKAHFYPAHALALALSPEDVPYSFNLEPDSLEIKAYLQGETLQAQGENGWYLVTLDHYALGWAKLVGTTLKNHYPKGLRRSL